MKTSLRKQVQYGRTRIVEISESGYSRYLYPLSRRDAPGRVSRWYKPDAFGLKRYSILPAYRCKRAAVNDLGYPIPAENYTHA